MKNSNNKTLKVAILIATVIIIAVLSVSCQSKYESQVKDYTKIKDEYKEYEDKIYVYGYLKKDEPNETNNDNACFHERGVFGYISDGVSHTYVCCDCLEPIQDPEPHSEVSIYNISKNTNIQIYAKSCAVCVGKLIGREQFFEITVTEKSPEEYETYYGVKLYGHN